MEKVYDSISIDEAMQRLRIAATVDRLRILWKTFSSFQVYENLQCPKCGRRCTATYTSKGYLVSCEKCNLKFSQPAKSSQIILSEEFRKDLKEIQAIVMDSVLTTKGQTRSMFEKEMKKLVALINMWSKASDWKNLSETATKSLSILRWLVPEAMDILKCSAVSQIAITGKPPHEEVKIGNRKVPVSEVVVTPAIRFQKVADQKVALGEKLGIEICVENESDQDIFEVKLEDEIPDQADFKHEGYLTFIWKCLRKGEKRILGSTLLPITVVGVYKLQPATLTFKDANGKHHLLKSNDLTLTVGLPKARKGTCPQCGALMPTSAFFCGMCGTHLQSKQNNSSRY